MAEFFVTSGAFRASLLGLLLAVPMAPNIAKADTAEAVRDVILPAYDQLAARADDLAQAAKADCSAAALEAPYQAAWDAWARIDFLRLGPVETNGRALAISFWPDAKSSGLRAQQALIDANAAAIDDAAAFGQLSVAMRGLGGLERLIYPSDLTGDAQVLCRLRSTTAANLAQMTADMRAEWDGFSQNLLTPGAAGNTTYLTDIETRQALYTQIMTGLEYLADTRLARPLGSFDKPRPERAEAAASGRSLRNITLSLEGIRDVTLALQPNAPQSRAAFERTIAQANALKDPVFAGAAQPQTRLKIEILQQSIREIRDLVTVELGDAMGLSVGFNAKDGD